MIPTTRNRLRLLTRWWPLSFAVFIALTTLYAGGTPRHSFIDATLDIVSLVVCVMLVASACAIRVMTLRGLAALGVVAVALLRAASLLDPNYITGQRSLGAAAMLMAAVSAMGWVMAADVMVLGSSMLDETGGGNGSDA